MFDFIRPEVRALIWRWRDLIIGIALILLGIWWGITSFGIMQWIGFALVVIGLLLGIEGIQRAQFGQGDDGPGVVQIRERRLGYFGPEDGGVIDLDDLNKLTLDPVNYAQPSWVLTGMGGQIVAIPINAKGADELFDAFATLPGIKTGSVLEALQTDPETPITIWSRDRPLLH